MSDEGESTDIFTLQHSRKLVVTRNELEEGIRYTAILYIDDEEASSLYNYLSTNDESAIEHAKDTYNMKW